MNQKKSISPDCLTDDEIVLVLGESASSPLLERATNHLNECAECIRRLEAFSIRNVSESMRPMFDSKHFCSALGNEPRAESDTQLLNDATLLHDTTANSSETEIPTINGYELKELLGRGGMGVVYRARQKGLNRDVAIKMISGGLDAGPERIARFSREAETLARINHPNVIRIIETGESKGHPFFAMELVPGENLAQLLDGTPWTNESAASLIGVTADAVDTVHQAGIIHRDLKPSNILLNGSPVAKNDFSSIRITDFGLAKPIWQAELTATGQAMGTLGYLAPEQALGHHDQIAPATDVYALGCILYELLTGRPPLVAPTMAETLRLITDVEPVSPKTLNPAIGKDLSTICLHCLHKNPERRYGSAKALSADLRRFLEGLPIHARPVSVFEKTWKMARRKPAMAAATLIATIAATGLLVTWIVFTNQLAHSKSVAETNSELAKANFNRAHQAARKYLDSSIQHTPEASSKNLLFQKQLMENGISFYEALIIPAPLVITEGDKSQQITIRNELAQLFFEYSKVLRFSMEHDATIDALDKAIQLCESSESIADSGDARARQIKASASVSKARAMVANQNSFKAALNAYEDALHCYKQLEEKNELKPDYLNWYRSVIHKNIASLHRKMGDQPEALKNIKQAEECCSKISKFVPDFQMTHSQIKLARAKVHRELQQYELASAKSNDAFDIIDRVCEQSSPPRIIYENQRVDCLTEMANLHQLEGQPELALELLDRAIKFQAGLISLHAENESLLLTQLMLLETKSSWLGDQDTEYLAIVEKIANIRTQLDSIADDPDRKLLSIKMQTQAADREGYRYNPQLAVRYYSDALELLNSLPEDHEPEVQSELRSGLLYRLAGRSLEINDYEIARLRASEYLASPGSHSAEVKTILAISAAMTENLEQARTMSLEVDWNDDDVTIFLGRKHLVDLVVANSQARGKFGEVLQQIRNTHANNLERRNGNQYLKEDLCRTVDWLIENSEADKKISEFIQWAKNTAVQILIDEAIPKYSDGARALTRDVRYRCLRGVADFEKLVDDLNAH